MATCTATSSLPWRWYWSMSPTSAVALLPARRRARPSTASASSCWPSWLIWPASRTWVSVSSRRPKSRSAAWRARSRSPVKTESRSASSSRRFMVVLSSGCDRVGQGQRIGALSLLLEELGQVEPQLRLGLRCLGHLGELGDRLFLVVVPPVRSPRAPAADRSHRRRSWPGRPAGGSGRPDRSGGRRACRARTPCAAAGSHSHRDTRWDGGRRSGCSATSCRPRSGSWGRS